MSGSGDSNPGPRIQAAAIGGDREPSRIHRGAACYHRNEYGKAVCDFNDTFGPR
jgi:hypothetical protein